MSFEIEKITNNNRNNGETESQNGIITGSAPSFTTIKGALEKVLDHLIFGPERTPARFAEILFLSRIVGYTVWVDQIY